MKSLLSKLARPCNITARRPFFKGNASKIGRRQSG